MRLLNVLAGALTAALISGAVFAGVYDYNINAASNTVINGVSAPIGAMPPSNVGPMFRALAAADGQWADDTGCAEVTGGTSTAYTLDLASNPYSGAATFANGDHVSAIIDQTNGGATTLNVESEGAKAVRKHDDLALVAGDLVFRGCYHFYYDASANGAAGAWLLGALAGDVLTATSTNTLTNKTLTSPTITTPTVNGITNGTGLAAGVWTPADASNTNLSSVTAREGQYLRVGATFTASVIVDVDATAGGAASFRLSIPVVSNLGAAADCSGSGTASLTDGPAKIFGDATDDNIEVQYNAVDTGATFMTLQFSCQVI